MAFHVTFSTNERWVPGIFLDAKDVAFLRAREPANPIDTLFRYGDPPRPLRAQFKSTTHKTIPHFVPVSGRWSVSTEAKALIEEFEPGVHEFIPVEIARPRSTKPILRLDGTSLDTPYYLFNIQVMLDAVWIERSPDVRVYPAPDGGPPMSGRAADTHEAANRSMTWSCTARSRRGTTSGAAAGSCGTGDSFPMPSRAK